MRPRDPGSNECCFERLGKISQWLIMFCIALIGAAVGPASTAAQEPRKSDAPQASVSSDEVARWVAENAPALTSALHNGKFRYLDSRGWESRRITLASIRSCVLSVTVRWSSSRPSEKLVSYEIPLAQVDVTGVRVAVDNESFIGDAPIQALFLPIAPAYGTAIVERAEDRTYQLKQAKFWVADAASGERLAEALRYASKLCGAKSSPF